MCLIITVLFLVLGIWSLREGDYAYAALHLAVALLFAALLWRNVKKTMQDRGKCSPLRCSILDLFRKQK